MKYNYYAGGQTSIDKTTFADGTINGPHLGGTGVFGYSGIRVWTDNVKPILNVGDDFYDFYGSWIDRNKVDCSMIKESYDKTFLVELEYQQDGYYEAIITIQQKLNNTFLYGYSNLRLEQVEKIAAPNAAIYMYYEPVNIHYFKELHKIAEKTGLKIMWEPGFSVCNEEFKEDYIKCIRALKPEMSTLNYFEASAMFGTNDEEKLIEIIESFEIPFFFFRVGKKGAYALSNGERYYVPSIDIEGYEPTDQTGCGNVSTAASMVGWIETKDPLYAGIYGNISAGFNIGSFGLIPEFNEEIRNKALLLKEDIYKKILICTVLLKND